MRQYITANDTVSTTLGAPVPIYSGTTYNPHSTTSGPNVNPMSTVQPIDNLNGWKIYPEYLPAEEGVYDVMLETGDIVTASLAYHSPGRPMWTFSKIVETFHQTAYKKNPRIIAWYPKPEPVSVERINKAKEHFKVWHR